jgi:hypothetical protein
MADNQEDNTQPPLMFTPRDNKMYAIHRGHEPIGIREFFDKYGEPAPPEQGDTDEDDRATRWVCYVYMGVERHQDRAKRGKDKQGQTVFVEAEHAPHYMQRCSDLSISGLGVMRWSRKRNKCPILGSMGIIGGVYLVAVAGDYDHELGRSVWLDGSVNAPIYLGRIAADHVATLSAYSQAERQAMTENKSLDKIRSQDLVKEQLAPLRRAYFRMNTRQQAQFVAEMIQYLNSGTTDPTSNW